MVEDTPRIEEHTRVEAVVVEEHPEHTSESKPETPEMQTEIPVESPLGSPEVVMTEAPIVPMPEQVIDVVRELNASNEGGIDQSTILDKPLFPKPPLFTE